MDHQDAQVTEIIAVLRADFASRLADAVAMLKAAGVDVDQTDDENNTVHGTVESYRLAEVEKLPCVHVVRAILTYIADYPPGDPRDRDGPEE